MPQKWGFSPICDPPKIFVKNRAPRVNILVGNALFPLRARQGTYFFPKYFEFWRYSTMVRENFKSCTSQMPRNASKLSGYVETKWLIDWYQGKYVKRVIILRTLFLPQMSECLIYFPFPWGAFCQNIFHWWSYANSPWMYVSFYIGQILFNCYWKKSLFQKNEISWFSQPLEEKNATWQNFRK